MQSSASSSSYLSSLIHHSSSAMAAQYPQYPQQPHSASSSPSLHPFASHARSGAVGVIGRLSEQTAAAASASSLAAFLSSHSAANAYAFDPSAAAAAASFLSKYNARPDVTTAAIVPLSPSSSAAAASSSPFSSHLLSPFHCSSLPSPSSPSAFAASPLRLKSGSSCHQCKTNKEPPHLYFCTSKTDTAVGRRSCRKKYCIACMSRWYKSLCHTGQPGLQQQQQQQPYSQSQQAAAAPGWSCPSCSGQCVCAACDRKKERANRKAADGEAEAETESAGGAEKEDAEERENSGGVALIGCKRERELSDGSSGVEAAASPFTKLVKLESSPALSAASSSPSSSASSLADRKQSSPPALQLPRPPAAYSRLQSDPGVMAAFTSPRQPSAASASRLQSVQPFSSASSAAAPAQAIASSLPPRPSGPSSSGRPPLPSSPFILPAAASASPLFHMDGMHEAAVQVITRYFNNSLAQQQQHAMAAQQQQQQQAQAQQQRMRAGLEHLRRGSDDVPALLSFSSSSSSSNVSTPITPNTPLMQPCLHQSYGQHDADAGMQLQLCSSSSSSSSSPPVSRAADKAQQLPSAALPMLFTAPRAVSTPVTGHETDRQIASRAMAMIAGGGSGGAGSSSSSSGGSSDAFELSLQSRAPSLCQSPLTLSQFNTPTLRSPAISLPASPRQALRQAQHQGRVRPSATDGDVFSASAIFNPQLSLSSALSVMGGAAAAAGLPCGDDYPERGSPLLPLFWCKSAISSLQSTPRHAANAAHSISSSAGCSSHAAHSAQQQQHGNSSGQAAAAAMGEMEFQALFN